MKLKLPGRRRLLRWLVAIIIVLIIIVFFVLPFVFGLLATLGGGSEVGDPPEGFQELSLTTTDQIELAAWYAPPKNGAVILLLHGSGDSREDIRPYAEMLVSHGFGVLALDMRGFGESGGDMNRFGWESTHDVDAAIAYLQDQVEVETIGGLGLSLGGETLLGAAGAYPELEAIVSDGASYRSAEEFMDLPAHHALYNNLWMRIMFFSVQLFSGQRPPRPLLESMLEAESTPLLLIAAGDNSLEVEYNEMFAEEVGEQARLWVVPGVGHTGAFRRYPEEYEQRVIAFFERTLLGE